MSCLDNYFGLKELFDEIGKKEFLRLYKLYDASVEIKKFTLALKNIFPNDEEYTVSKDDVFRAIVEFIIYDRPCFCNKALDSFRKYGKFKKYLEVSKESLKARPKEDKNRKKAISKTLRIRRRLS